MRGHGCAAPPGCGSGRRGAPEGDTSPPVAVGGLGAGGGARGESVPPCPPRGGGW